MEKLQCPNCQSYKTKAYSRSYKFTIGVLLAVAGYLLTLGFDKGFLILFAIVGFAMIAIGLTYILLGLTHGKTKVICKSCANDWRID